MNTKGICRHGANTDLTTVHGHRPYDRIYDLDSAEEIVAMLDGPGPQCTQPIAESRE